MEHALFTQWPKESQDTRILAFYVGEEPSHSNGLFRNCAWMYPTEMLATDLGKNPKNLRGCFPCVRIGQLLRASQVAEHLW
jgi:hypothetical protein